MMPTQIVAEERDDAKPPLSCATLRSHHLLKEAVGSIWINADAAARWLKGDPENLAEAEKSLASILAQCRRAAEVLNDLSVDQAIPFGKTISRSTHAKLVD